jgi:hypothetical protein
MSCVVVCIVLGIDYFGGGPCPPLYSLRDSVVDILVKYYSGSFLLYQLVILVSEYITIDIDIRYGTCPIPILEYSMPCTQPVDSGLTSPRALRSRVLQAFEYF